jgi:hypothetical protein
MRPHLLAEPFASKRDALTGDQFAVEPGRSVMADLLVETWLSACCAPAINFTSTPSAHPKYKRWW